ncbi:MAG: hypothetical protein ACP5DZ_01430 [Bacteroidales bacterium]
MKKFKFIAALIIPIVLIGFLSCEKEDLEIKETSSEVTDLSGFVDMSYYKNHKGIKTSSDEIAPPYYFTWQVETAGIDVVEECTCLRTDEGNCLWEVTIIANKSNTDIYSLFLDYYNINETIQFFEKEKWYELFPMLQESTVQSILNNELIIGHNNPQGSEVSYFYFSRPGADPSVSDNILFTLQLIVD